MDKVGRFESMEQKPKTKEEYLALIKQYFPEVKFEISELFTNGWDNNAVILDNRLVFRFPKREWVPFKAEVRLLKYLVPKLPISVPDYIYLPEDLSFGGYKMLHGEQMRPEFFSNLSEDQKITVAQQLGSFLSALHLTPLQVIKDAGFDGEVGDYRWSKNNIGKLFKEAQEKVFAQLNSAEIGWIKYQFEKYLSLSFDIDTVVAHSDFTSDHILFDKEEEKITGILDFTDIRLYDSALDFAGLWDYGNWLPEKAISYYTGRVNKDFLQRSKITRLLGMIGNMLDVINGEDLPVTFEQSKEELRKIMESGLTL